MGRPQFSSADVTELRSLGVSDSQIRHLNAALLHVRLVISTKPKRRETAELLADVEALSGELSRKLALLVTPPEPEYAWAHTLLEEGYWLDPERQDDLGATLSHHLVPRLEAVNKAAKAAIESMPEGQTRQRRASPRAIKWIANALLSGWLADQHDPIATNRPLPPYPSEFDVSKAVHSPFRKIAGICYRAAGGNADPLRAIESYLAAERLSRQEVMAALEAGIAAASK